MSVLKYFKTSICMKHIKFYESELKRLKVIRSNIRKTIKSNDETIKLHSCDYTGYLYKTSYDTITRTKKSNDINTLCLRDVNNQIERVQDKIEKHKTTIDQLKPEIPPSIYIKKRNLFDDNYYSRHAVFMERELRFRKRNGNMQYPQSMLGAPVVAKPVNNSTALRADVVKVL